MSLSAALQKKAEEELGEKTENREKDIAKLRDLVKSDLALHCPHDDDAFLLMFLRARKFRHEAAAELIHRYYEVRKDYPDFYQNFRPSAAKTSYESGLYVKLPKSKETDPQVVLIQAGLWDPATTSVDDMFKGNILQIERWIRMEENQVNGITILADMSGLSWNQAKNMNPFVAKRATSILQQAMPCRLKGIHYVNVPHFFEYIFAMVKPFLSEKLRNRIHVHSAPEYLKEHFDLDTIPKGLGGTLDITPVIKEWAKEMAASEDEFKSWEKYGIKQVDAVSSNNKNADAVGGVTGTFKKLNCD